MTNDKTLEESGIDSKQSLQILARLEANQLISSSKSDDKKLEIPAVDGEQLIDLSSDVIEYQLQTSQLKTLSEQFPELQCTSLYQRSAKQEQLLATKEEIEEVGLLLSPYFGFGLLNGGSASSYFDQKKNHGFSPQLYELFSSEFESLKAKYQSLPKALCPAFLEGSQDEGFSEGPSFMSLKLRSVLEMQKSSRDFRERKALGPASSQMKVFQMTSQLTQQALAKYLKHNWQNDTAQLGFRASQLGWLPEENISGAQQSLISTFSKDAAGKWSFFSDKNGDYLPMPGGHGQVFTTLKETWRELRRQGIHYISIGNIDNIAYNPEKLFIGLLALSGKNAFFACSYRTAVDNKGGVLLRQPNGKLSCFDIGVGVDKSIFQRAEEEEKPLLFNCAIGYFHLDYLLDNIERIIAQLPLRISEQNKEKGHYWQVEQVAWEVLGLLDSSIIGAVKKEEYFLAAKLQLESFVNSAYSLKRYEEQEELKTFASLAVRLGAGLKSVLARDCNYTLSD